MIKHPTGKGRINRPVDVVIMQLLLNDVGLAKDLNSPSTTGPTYVVSSDCVDGNLQPLASLAIDGLCTSDLGDRIMAYQKARSMRVVDGWAGPTGGTIKALLTDAGIPAGTTRMAYIRQKLKSPCGVRSINVDTVAQLYDKQYSVLSTTSKEGLKYILKTAKADVALYAIPVFAYMLATTKHETAHTFLGIEEYGKGNGRPYGNEVTVVDPATKKEYKNKYYGRGYVQLTWGFNYQRIDHKLGHGVFPNRHKTKEADYNKGFSISAPTKSIYLNPAKALDQENAYVGLVWGMLKGIYTGRTIGNYVNGVKIDYYNARRVINGTDKAADIAVYAEDFETLLLASTA